MYLPQDRFIFRARSLTPGELTALLAAHPGVEPVVVADDDGVELHGWSRPGGGPERQDVVIYYGGNGSLAVDMLPHAGELGGRSLVVMDYRGYGVNRGRPGEDLLYRDALTVFDHFAAHADVAADRIFLVGFSLGTTVVTRVAAERPVRAVVLAARFTSIPDLVQRQFPFLPWDRLVRNPMRAAAAAPHVRAPLLVLMTADDEVVPNSHSHALAGLWGGPVRMHLEPLFWESINRFFDDF